MIIRKIILTANGLNKQIPGSQCLGQNVRQIISIRVRLKLYYASIIYAYCYYTKIEFLPHLYLHYNSKQPF